MNPMLRSLSYEQLLAYYNGMVSPKKGTKSFSGSKKSKSSAIQDAYMEIVARVQRAQAHPQTIETGMRVMVTPMSLSLDFRVPVEAIVTSVRPAPGGGHATIRFLDNTGMGIELSKCRAVLPLGVTALGRR